MKVYGSEICIDCRNYLTIQKMRGFENVFRNPEINLCRLHQISIFLCYTAHQGGARDAENDFDY